MDEQTATRLLHEHGIKPTANRIVIAKALAAGQQPMSMRELETRIQTIDKSNIFRTLTLFREQHLVHTMEDGSDTVRYELCFSHDEDEDEDLHVHFYCEHCRRTYCLYDIPIPDVALPHGFQQTSANFMVKGLCSRCRGVGNG